jgi:hypothetical protein
VSNSLQNEPCLGTLAAYRSNWLRSRAHLFCAINTTQLQGIQQSHTTYRRVISPRADSFHP